MNPPGESAILVEGIAQRLVAVRQAIAAAAKRSDRNHESIQLVTVSKRHSIDVISAAYACGLRDFGENYAEEAQIKMAQLSHLPGIRWEMVGHVQSRKTRLVAHGFTRVQSIDSLKLGILLNRERGESEPPLPILVEVNVSGETTKSGFDASDSGRWPELLEHFKRIAELPSLSLQGLMVMPPLQTIPELNRIYFQKAFKLLQFINSARCCNQMTELSMGTSSDFKIAIEEGATIIRLGEALLGPRPARN